MSLTSTDLHLKLAEWSSNELNCPQNSNSELSLGRDAELFAELSSSMSHARIWHYVINNVKRNELNKTDVIKGTINTIDDQIEKLETEIESLEAGISTAKSKWDNSKREIGHSNKIGAFLKAYGHVTSAKMTKLRNLESRISAKNCKEGAETDISSILQLIVNKFGPKNNNGDAEEENAQFLIVEPISNFAQNPYSVINSLTAQIRSIAITDLHTIKNPDLKDIGFSINNSTGELTELDFHEAANSHMETLFHNLRQKHVQTFVDYRSEMNKIAQNACKIKQNRGKTEINASKIELNEDKITQIRFSQGPEEECKAAEFELICTRAQIKYIANLELPGFDPNPKLGPKMRDINSFDDKVRAKHDQIMHILGLNLQIGLDIMSECSKIGPEMRPFNLAGKMEGFNEISEQETEPHDLAGGIKSFAAISSNKMAHNLVGKIEHFGGNKKAQLEPCDLEEKINRFSAISGHEIAQFKSLKTDLTTDLATDMKLILNIPDFQNKVKLLERARCLEFRNKVDEQQAEKISAVYSDLKLFHSCCDSSVFANIHSMVFAANKLQRDIYTLLKSDLIPEENEEIWSKIERSLDDMKEQTSFRDYKELNI